MYEIQKMSFLNKKKIYIKIGYKMVRHGDFRSCIVVTLCIDM